MALINRLSRLFRADFHAVLDQIEEPEALLKQAIRDMEDDLANTEQRIKLRTPCPVARMNSGTRSPRPMLSSTCASSLKRTTWPRD